MDLSEYFSNSYIFGIAIEKYTDPSINDLRTPSHDLKKICEQLERPCNAFKSMLLQENKTDRCGIEAFLHDMITVVNERKKDGADNRNRLIFYFAGHGKTLENSNGTATGYIIPKDGKVDDETTWISMDYLLDAFYRIECRHVLIILDCCFAGSMEWASFNMRGVYTEPREVYKQHFLLYAKDKAWQVITSSAFDQTSLDYGWRNKPGSEHSPFAQALISALEGEADLLHNGLITASALAVYLRNAVEGLATDKNIRHRQTPRLFTLKKHDKGEYLFLNPNSPLLLKDAIKAVKENNPFKGLEPYKEQDHGKFHGRDEVITKIIHIVQEKYADSYAKNFLVITGISGSGKSSVVKAGVKPIMEADGWKFTGVIRPGEKPLASLQKIELPDGEQKIILIIDQLEELVTQSKSKEEAEQFIEELHNKYLSNKRVFIIATLRSDFQHLISKGKLEEIWEASRYSIPWFNRQEIKEIITRPAINMAFFYEPVSLVESIADDVLQFPGSLPMLSVLLSQLYIKSIENNRNRLLDRNDYIAIGGVAGALQSKLKELLGENDQNEWLLRIILLRMVNIEGGIYTKRKVCKQDLIYKNPLLNSAIEKEISILVKERIIHSTETGEEGWEPVHDAVVRWNYIKKWIEEIGIARMGIQRELENDLSIYNSNGQSKQDLWDRNERLQTVVTELKEPEDYLHSVYLNEAEHNFIVTSEKRKNATKRRTWIIVSSVMFLLLAIALFSNQLRKEAVISRKEAESSLKNFRIAKFKESVQNGNTYMDANESLMAKEQYDSAKVIYNLYMDDKNADSSMFSNIDKSSFLKRLEELGLK